LSGRRRPELPGQLGGEALPELELLPPSSYFDVYFATSSSLKMVLLRFVGTDIELRLPRVALAAAGSEHRRKFRSQAGVCASSVMA
jgi:hypothetical protein